MAEHKTANCKILCFFIISFFVITICLFETKKISTILADCGIKTSCLTTCLSFLRTRFFARKIFSVTYLDNLPKIKTPSFHNCNNSKFNPGVLLRLANQSDTTPARAERGVHAASTFKTQAGQAFYAPRGLGR
jgi:hypothetical protein